MNVLLDTHVFLWTLDRAERLPRAVFDVMKDRANAVFFSAINVWEIAIKAALGRADFTHRPEAMLEMALDLGFTELPVTSEVAATVAHLPPHHRDPFDRLLVAQAMSMPARLYTADRRLAPYSELVTLIR